MIRRRNRAAVAQSTQDAPVAAVADDETPGPTGAAEGTVSAGDDDEVIDPAAEARAWQQAAQSARARGEAVQAEARQRAQAIITAAEAAATRFGLQARDAGEEAARWQKVADRDARIARTEADLAAAAGRYERLALEAARLDGEAAEAAQRLAVLAERRRDAERRRAEARGLADVDTVKDAVAELAAVAEVALAESSRREQAEARLARIRGEAGELAESSRDVARAALELGELRRERAGLPRRAEVVAVAQRVLGMRVGGLLVSDPRKLADAMTGAAVAAARAQAEAAGADADAAGESAAAQVAAMVAAAGEVAVRSPGTVLTGVMPMLTLAASPVLLPEIITWLEQLAATDLAGYEQVAGMAFRTGPEPVPSPAGQALGYGADAVRLALSGGPLRGGR